MKRRIEDSKTDAKMSKGVAKHNLKAMEYAVVGLTAKRMNRENVVTNLERSPIVGATIPPPPSLGAALHDVKLEPQSEGYSSRAYSRPEPKDCPPPKPDEPRTPFQLRPEA